nr:reverse transcriptase domain-containing protein [Tanacetum cinerariifolium]
SGTLPGNTVTNPKDDLKGITTRSGVSYQGPTIPTPSKVAKQGIEVTKDQVQTSNSQSTAPVQPMVTQSESKTLVSEPVVAPVSAPMSNLKPSIPYPSRRDNERRRDQANEQIEKFYEILKEMSFEISFTDALMLMPKFASTLKALIGNKEKLTLADLGASINLKPLCVWKGLSLFELTPTCITLELVDRTESKPVGIAKDVKVKVGVFHFPADFVVVDFEPDPRVPLILGRCFLNTSRALIDVHKGELTLRIGNKAITYNLDQTSRYSANYYQMMANKIDVTDEACEEYSQEVLGFSDVTTSGSPTPSDDPIVSTTSPTLTPFGDNDFLLFEEADAFLGLADNPDSSELDPSYYDPEGEILSLEAILNSDPSPPLLNHEQSMPSFKEELKACEAKTIKSSIDESPEVELKDLPPHLEYAFLEGDNKLPVIIAKALRDEEKYALIKVLKSHKRDIAWKLSDIQGGFTVVANEENELIPTCLVTGWRVCIDYRKLIEATRKDYFPLPFMDQMLDRLAGNEYYCFLDGFFKYFQIPIDPRDQEKTIFTCPYGTFAYRRMPFGLCNASGTFQRLHTDHFALKYLFAKKDAKARLLCWVMPLQEFDFTVINTKGAKNLAADHLSRLENPYENVLDLKEINENFPLETLSMVTYRGNSDTPWFADFVNYHAAYKTPIEGTPYKLVYGKACHLPIKLEQKAYLALKQTNFNLSVAGDHRKIQLNKLNELRDHAYENSLIYKEKTKRIHDSKIKNCVFNVGDQVLLFNSRLMIFLGKLKSCWSGPFTIAKVFPYGTVELSQANGLNFKVNGHRIKHYFRRDIPKLVVLDLQTFPLDQT